MEKKFDIVIELRTNESNLTELILVTISCLGWLYISWLVSAAVWLCCRKVKVLNACDMKTMPRCVSFTVSVMKMQGSFNGVAAMIYLQARVFIYSSKDNTTFTTYQP